MMHARSKLIGFLSAFSVLAVLSFLAPSHALAAGSTICETSPCVSSEVGPFMAGISQSCGNDGTCSFEDIQTVFANVGNWVLGIVGALVLLAYVVGGFYFLLSGMPGMEKYREKGKTALKQSTIGLVIVFVAFAAIKTLESTLKGGSISNTGNYVSCGPGNINSGSECELNSTCTDAGLCVSKCEQRNVNATYSLGGVQFYECVDTTASPESSNYGKGANTHAVGEPETGLCPGGTDNLCVQFILMNTP